MARKDAVLIGQKWAWKANFAFENATLRGRVASIEVRRTWQEQIESIYQGITFSKQGRRWDQTNCVADGVLWEAKLDREYCGLPR